MRFRWRQLRPGELDPELIWLCVTAAAAATGALWLWLQLPTPRCTFRALTGLPCVTCGATRAALALLHGDFSASWRLNPLVFTAFIAVALFDLYAVVVLLTSAARLRIEQVARRTRLIIAVSAAALALLNWIYLLRQ